MDLNFIAEETVIFILFCIVAFFVFFLVVLCCIYLWRKRIRAKPAVEVIYSFRFTARDTEGYSGIQHPHGRKRNTEKCTEIRKYMYV